MMRIVKDLAIALVNATVLLLIVLGVVVLMVVNRADDVAEDVIGAVAPTGERLDRIALAIERIEAGIATEPEGAALAAEIAALRTEVADLRAAVAGLDGLTLEAMLAALGARIAGAQAEAGAP
jgi:cell division protein FtsB